NRRTSTVSALVSCFLISHRSTWVNDGRLARCSVAQSQGTESFVIFYTDDANHGGWYARAGEGGQRRLAPLRGDGEQQPATGLRVGGRRQAGFIRADTLQLALGEYLVVGGFQRAADALADQFDGAGQQWQRGEIQAGVGVA